MSEIDEERRDERNLLELLSARARHASDGRLAVDAIGGLAVAALAAYWSGPGWELLVSAATCFCCFGLWGMADRELRERPDAAPRTLAGLRVLRLIIAVVGFGAGTFLVLATLAIVLGRMIS